MWEYCSEEADTLSMRELLLDGWEPFAVTERRGWEGRESKGDLHEVSITIVHLRRRQSAES